MCNHLLLHVDKKRLTVCICDVIMLTNDGFYSQIDRLAMGTLGDLDAFVATSPEEIIKVIGSFSSLKIFRS